MVPWTENNVETNNGAYLTGDLRRESRHQRVPAGGIALLKQW
jgi:hypothetical protein